MTITKAEWPTFHLTFGARYATETHPTCPSARPDGWVAVVAPNLTAARAFVIDRFGTRWCDLYGDDTFQPSYYPLGELARIVADPPALVLPDGWERRTDSDGPYYRRFIEFAGHVDAHRGGAMVVAYVDAVESPDRIRALGEAITEAAGIVEQLRAGAQ